MQFGDNASQVAIVREQLQRDFLSAITSVTRRDIMLKKDVRRLESYLGNPFLDINFQIDGISPLAKATSQWRVLDRLLQHQGIDMNFCTSDGRTSISFAVECPETDSLRLLIDKGALPDQRDNEGRTPLSFAAELGHLDHVRILADANADIDSVDSKGWTPLFWALWGQHLETAKYLLSNQDVNSDRQDTKGRTPLGIAAETGNAESIRYLIDAKAKGRRITGGERDLLLWTIFQRDIVTARLLLKADKSLANHRVKGRTPLSMAIERGEIGTTKLLIDAGADVHALDEVRWPTLDKWLFEHYLPPDEILLEIEHFSASHHPTKQPPLSLAAEFGRVDILQVLLEANAKVNSVDAEKRTALAWAVEKGHHEAVKILLGVTGISVDCRDATGRTPLIMAASVGEIDIFKQLLKSNAAINSEDEQKWTSLSWAVANGKEPTVKFLLEEAGASVDCQDRQGRTPFSLAAERGFIQIMRLLIQNRADPHFSDNEGHTGFWWFLKARNDLSIKSPNHLSRPQLAGTVNPFDLQFLIWELPVPNKKDRSGRNWLSWAAEYGDDEVVRYFLDEDMVDKVDINICDGTEDPFSRTPLIWALEGEHETSVHLLKNGDTISLHLLVEGISSIAQEKALDLVIALLQAGYNRNQPDQKGRTPLHIACLGGSEKLISALIRENADLGSRDHTGKTPLQYALRARRKAVVDILLNAPSTDLEPVTSKEWFAMSDKQHSWVQITRRSQSCGFKLDLVDGRECNWLPRAKETRLCICEQSSIWSNLPWKLGFCEKIIKEGYYWNYAQKDFGYRSVTYISLSFPNKQGKCGDAWGIAWTGKKTAEGLATGFISMLPSGRIPHDPSDFFRLFLETLHQEWKAKCSNANARVEMLRHDQVKKRGRSYDLVDELAQDALERAELRQCLRSHVEGLLEAVTTNVSLEIEGKLRLREVVNEIDQAVTAKLDHLEQAARDLLQIELAWVSTNEAASLKRLSWINFIFLPLMFVSSLFGMNVNLLQDNPDWRWVILFGIMSLVTTGILWLISKCIPQVVQGNMVGIFSRKKRAKASPKTSV